MEELLSLKWNNHRTTFIHILGVLRDKQAYTDVTLACDGKFYSVHKLVLSTCSDYFCAMFDKTACKSPVIVLKDIKCEDLEALLDYMYLGEVNVRQSDLASLIKAAENLRIKGLAVPDDEPPKSSSVNAPLRTEPIRRDGGSGSPPSKRKRRDEGEDGREDVRPAPSQPVSRKSPPPSRPKSPVMQRLSPSPHRTSLESPEERSSRPLPSPAETGQPSSLTSSQPTAGQQGASQYRSDDTPSFVKVEMEDEQPDDLQADSYDLSTDGYKEEGGDSSTGMNSDLPEFLQAAASGALSGSSTSFPHPTFAGPSGYQPGDLAGWQGDSSLGFPAHLNFSTSESSSQQNAPGALQHHQQPPQYHHLPSSPSLAPPLPPPPPPANTMPPPPPANPNVDYPCPTCGKRFHYPSLLTRHIRVHTGERPYPCPYCSHRSNQKSNLVLHIRANHGTQHGNVGPVQQE